MRRFVFAIALAVALIGSLATVAPTAAHVHRTENNPHHDQELADGQNHPAFVPNAENGMWESCAGISELPNTGPAGYGLETAHHGPDQGTPGKGDGCYATVGPPQDGNPAIQ